MDSAIIGVIVGGAIGVIGSAIGGAFLLVNGNRQRQADRLVHQQEERVAFRRRQLSDLYGPLYLERRRSERLRDQLPQEEPDGSRWRLVHHIGEVKGDPHRREVVERILDAGDRIADLIRGHGGLVEPQPPPEAFAKFLLHNELLRMSWETGKDQDPDGSHPFPGGISSKRDMSRCLEEPGAADNDIDCAIYLGMRAIQADLEGLLGLASGSFSVPQSAVAREGKD